MNTVKNQTTIHLRLNQIDKLEVVILLMTYEKDYIWDPCTFSCKNVKYSAACIIDNSVITCDEIIQETKAVATNFNEKM